MEQWERNVLQYSARFRAAVDAGQLKAYHGAHSPKDTAEDTRYQYADAEGTHTLLHSEVNGFLTGLERERQTAGNSGPGGR